MHLHEIATNRLVTGFTDFAHVDQLVILRSVQERCCEALVMIAMGRRRMEDIVARDSSCLESADTTSHHTF